MPDRSELLTVPEAAMVAAVTVRDVNRVIDERILPERFYTLDGGRRVRAMACPLVGFWFHTAHALTAEERGLLIRRLSDRIEPRATPGDWKIQDWTIQDGFLTVDLRAFVIDAETRHARLAEARAIVVEDPGILGGTPVIRGTRVPVHDVGAMVAARTPLAEIRECYPHLDEPTIALAALYAAAIPARGRPRSPAMLAPGAPVLSRHVVSRQPLA